MKNKSKYAIIVLIASIIGISTYLIFKKSPHNWSSISTSTGEFKNLLVITLDTTRSDKIGSYGCTEVKTPNIDGLATLGARFENAYTPVPLTLPAHCSIFTGTYPIYHKVRNNGSYFLPEQIDTLAEQMKKQGYKTSAFVSSFVVDSRFGLDQGFDVYNDNLDIDKNVKVYHSERIAEKVFDDFSLWFTENSNKKFFSWVHFFDPHMPYAAPEPFGSEYSDNPYLGEIAYTDSYVGKIINLLKENGIFDKTIIIISGDHGEAFGEHQEYGHQVFCYNENLKVPLIIYAKGKVPINIVKKEKVVTIDIMPTVLDLLQFPIPKQVQGQSLLPLIKGLPFVPEDIYIESIFAKEALGCAPIKGIIQNDHKYIDLPQPELYNLLADPEEKDNLISAMSHIGKKLKNRVDHMIERLNTMEYNPQREMTAEEKKRLASLGYITLAGQTIPDQALPDPKVGIKGFNEFSNGMQAHSMNNNTKAEGHFLKAIDITPQYTAPYTMLAQIYKNTGRTDEALQIFKKGIKNNPYDNTIKLEYSKTLLQLEKIDEAQQVLEELVKLNPADSLAQVHIYLAGIYITRGNVPLATGSYQKALEIEPGNLYIKKQLAYTLHLTNRFTEALKYYTEIEKETPDDLKLTHDMAILFAQLNQVDKAESYFEKLMKHNPHNNIYYNYALLLGKKGNYSKAIKMMETFLSMYPQEDGKKNFARQNIAKWKQSL